MALGTEAEGAGSLVHPSGGDHVFGASENYKDSFHPRGQEDSLWIQSRT